MSKAKYAVEVIECAKFEQGYYAKSEFETYQEAIIFAMARAAHLIAEMKTSESFGYVHYHSLHIGEETPMGTDFSIMRALRYNITRQDQAAYVVQIRDVCQLPDECNCDGCIGEVENEWLAQYER